MVKLVAPVATGQIATKVYGGCGRSPPKAGNQIQVPVAQASPKYAA